MIPTPDDIRALQRVLASLGQPVEVDGDYGNETRKALYAANVSTQMPDDPNTEQLIKELEFEEGFRSYVYKDNLGWWTIGIGRLVDKRKGGGITRAEADLLKRNDVATKRAALDARIPWWRQLDPVRQRAVQNMAFQMGTRDMHGPTFNAIRDGDYKRAATLLRRWKWAKQTPERATRVIKMIETGRATRK